MKGRKMILVIFVIALTVIVMAIGVGIKEKDEAVKPTEPEVADLLYREVIPEKEYSLSKEYGKPFEEASWITVEKVDRTTVEDKDGGSKTTYHTYVVSDVDLKNQKDDTEDYVRALASEEMDDSLVRRVNFDECFGFSYRDLNGYEVLEKLMDENGFDGSLYDTEYDENTYDMTKQNLYVLKNDCSVIKQMLDGVEHDELIESKVSYQTIKTDDGVVIPDCITAVVKYRIGEDTYTRNIFLQVSINNWEEMEGANDME